MNTKKILAAALPILATTGLFLWASSKSQAQNLETVPEVDLKKYAGTWFEIAAIPQSFEKGCACTKATYTPTDQGYIIIENTCEKPEKNKTTTVKGKAFVEEGSGNAKLKVQFFWPFKGKYWIIDLAQDYSYAVVGHPNRKYLWILSRTPSITEELYNHLLQGIAEKGFDLSKIEKTPQCEE